MTREEEVRRLNKELTFLDSRWKSFRHNLRTVTAGSVTAVVNGLASPHYAHFQYLERRRERVLKRLQELGGCR